mmetsp:Transcript_4663/g.8736  ORF Transcript_4663/g.8736 Transcript_4663/m.8736 type:complete len:82 (+) Transcript_4663:529-774(+)|eukprot:CAMPEP_0114231972 /NCGR_PEP_ID=MMETSP0058-20121206/4346_1 /TAXON_ID=36894 /ORGANISM="Pyramimonas parkeae, CCMP726" /LENGTH=81 /DNA_ID=CAMNT_0001343391 /DNA_START=255 /DNA_END=500 /DNA_ORIENTATION=+
MGQDAWQLKLAWFVAQYAPYVGFTTAFMFLTIAYFLVAWPRFKQRWQHFVFEAKRKQVDRILKEGNTSCAGSSSFEKDKDA